MSGNKRQQRCGGHWETFRGIPRTNSTRSKYVAIYVLRFASCVEKYQDIFYKEFDAEIARRIKEDRQYEGDKPNPKDWSDLLDSDKDFRKEFQKVFNNEDIPQEDDYLPEILDDTYVNMEVALPRGNDGPQFAQVIKQWDTNRYC